MQLYEIVVRLKLLSAEAAVGTRQGIDLSKEIDKLIENIEDGIREEAFYMSEV